MDYSLCYVSPIITSEMLGAVLHAMQVWKGYLCASLM